MRCHRSLLVAVGRCCCCHRCCHLSAAGEIQPPLTSSARSRMTVGTSSPWSWSPLPGRRPSAGHGRVLLRTSPEPVSCRIWRQAGSVQGRRRRSRTDAGGALDRFRWRGYSYGGFGEGTRPSTGITTAISPISSGLTRVSRRRGRPERHR